jgi:poly(A) polymerase/tRNA nucleotidyltransferase (CCA-adding enzyme)
MQINNHQKFNIPIEIITILSQLKSAGFEAYVVGGCVRDLLLDKKPHDWDITTQAQPEEILKIFPDSVYENKFGTVGVKVKTIKKEKNKSDKGSEKMKEPTEIVEVTTYRIESQYSDKRHPDKIKFAQTLKEDLSRRDFTINAMAFELVAKQKLEKELEKAEFQLVDLFEGQKDLEKKIIRTVGKAEERFNEDALRMMRAIRFAVTLNFQIEEKTFQAIQKKAPNLKYISAERIKDEFKKIILADKPAQGIKLLHKTGLLVFILPELEASYDIKLNHHHLYGPYNTVYKHLVASLEKCPSQKLEVRLAALLHDIGKPKVKKGKGEKATFYNHEYAGAYITEKILTRLKFSRQIIEKVVALVRNHMFYYNVDEVGASGVRKVIKKIGLENIHDLIDVRIADRLGSGVPKAVPYKLRHFQYMVEKVSQDAISVKQLKINGNDLIKELKIAPGPKIGAILEVLLAEVIDKPQLNRKKDLLMLAKKLNESDLAVLRAMAQKKIAQEKKVEDKNRKEKYWVQ